MTFEGGYRPGRHTRGFALHVHLVFVTTHRSGVFDGAGLREFNGEADHVYLLVDYPPNVAVSALVNSLKGVSGGRLCAESTGRVNRASICGHFWFPSYLAASCGDAPLSIIRQHIEQQQRPA